MCEKFTNIINHSDIKDDKNNKKISEYDEFCNQNKIKQFKLGYSQFIGELFNKNLIINGIIDNFVEELINNIFVIYEDDPNDQNLENNIIALCKLINTSYTKYPKIIKDKQIYKKIYSLKLNKKLKFKILDILEL